MKSLWEQDAANGLTGLDALVYRSNRLGADRTVVNWGGGNTSAKQLQADFRGRQREVIWVKGSGSDLASATARSFTPLYMEEIRPLLDRESMTDEEMVEYLSHCVTGPGYPRFSIETLLHGFLPFAHVDHTHPDAAIALACAANGREIARRLYGDEMVWVPYVRPGFQLSKMIAEEVAANPSARIVIMEKHGAVTWGDTPAACYQNTISLLERAERYILDSKREKPAFGGPALSALPAAERRQALRRILPALRGALGARRPVILQVDDAPEVLEFVCSRDGAVLSQVGAACPDHLVHTKRVPLWVDWKPGEPDLGLRIAEGLQRYEAEYRAYQEANRNPGDPDGDPMPRVILIPGIGMITTGKDKLFADVAAQLYHRAISVMKAATAIDRFVSLSPKESYDVEYWPLELYKLTLAPAERQLSRQVALVTGGAGGIGRAVVERLAREGAHIVVGDIDEAGARAAADAASRSHGFQRAVAVTMNVTSEASVVAAYDQAVLTYGGVDIVISNAGLASSSPLEETSLAEWQKNIDVLGTGYFLVSREAFRIWKEQKAGGALVFVASKNGLVAGKNAAAYSAAKAAEVHLARCLAEEGGAHSIRVNTVCPDAIMNTGIWSSAWREERAAAYGIPPEKLEEFYRNRTTLKVNVLAEDVAEGVFWFASPAASKTTGCILTVDGGVPAAYPR